MADTPDLVKLEEARKAAQANVAAVRALEPSPRAIAAGEAVLTDEQRAAAEAALEVERQAGAALRAARAAQGEASP